MTSKRIIIGNSYSYIIEDAIKKAIVDFLYSTINLSNYRYNLLTNINKLKYLQENEHYVAPNYKGYNYLFILITVYGMNHAVLIDRKKLSYHKHQLDIKNLQIYKIKVDISETMYSGTIIDGKIINNKANYTFLIQDCLSLMNTSLINMDMIEKLEYIQIIINSQFNNINNNCSPNFEFKLNKLYTYEDIENIISNINDFDYPTSGLIFYPKKSGTNIIYLDKKNVVIDYNTPIQQDKIELKSIDIITNYTEYVKSRSYHYEDFNNNQNKSKDLWLLKTCIPDVYEIFENQDSIKLGIALIPNLKISHLCDNIINEKPYKFKCIYSTLFKKWIPILPISE